MVKKQIVKRPTNAGKMVLSALTKLMRNTGWTARTIVKFIRMEYHIEDPTLNRRVTRALQRGVRLGVIQSFLGRYRLTTISRLAQLVSSSELMTRRVRHTHTHCRRCWMCV